MPEDALDILKFVNKVSKENLVRVEEDLGSGFVRLNDSEAQRRQALHDISNVEVIVTELLRNSRDAGAFNIFISTSNEDGIRTITIIDDGAGIPNNLIEHVFEPRVTSKLDTMSIDDWGVHGRGMALYSIRSNTIEAIILDTILDGGTSIRVIVDTNNIPEKTDQSTWPSLKSKNKDGDFELKGPHNLIRTILEFAYRHKDTIKVYFGSPADIVATLIQFGQKRLSDDELFFCDDINMLDLTKRLAANTGALELAEISATIGLSISERTAHRILQEQIHPTLDIVDEFKNRSNVGLESKSAPLNKSLKISSEDLDHFSRTLESAFEPIANKYYLTLLESPQIRITKNGITVTFQADKGD